MQMFVHGLPFAYRATGFQQGWCHGGFARVWPISAGRKRAWNDTVQKQATRIPKWMYPSCRVPSLRTTFAMKANRGLPLASLSAVLCLILPLTDFVARFCPEHLCDQVSLYF